MIEIYTDGGSRGNPSIGGMAYVAIQNGEVIKESYYGFSKTTNNRMELGAVLIAMNQAILSGWKNIKIYSDSKYVVNAFNEGWLNNWILQDFRKRANSDLWKKIYPLRDEFDKLEFEWVRGHSGNRWNEHADFLVNKAMDNRDNFHKDHEYEDRS